MMIHDPQNNPYSCKVCDKGFTTKYVYERHVMENHKDNDQTFPCTECDKRYTSERNLQRHIDTKHSGKPKHVCNICEEQFQRTDVLKKHQRFVHQIETRKVILPGINENVNHFECYVCEVSFKEKYKLNRHLETMHNDNSDRYNCPTCGKQFKRKITCRSIQKPILKSYVKTV
jgi:uncharacterized Zn-finger protein